MSRISTQDDRLIRGPESFQIRTTVDPVRIAPAREDTISQLIQSVGVAAGAVAGVVEKKKRVEEEQASKLRAKEFNTAVSELTRLEDEWQSDPNNDGKDYLKSLTSYENVFAEDTDEGVKIRRQFSTGPQVKAAEQKQSEDALKARQGGYVRTAKSLTDTYQSVEQIDENSLLDFPERKAKILSEMLEAYPAEVREDLSDKTLFAIEEEASKAATFSNALFKEKQDFFQSSVDESRYTDLLVNTVNNNAVSVEEVNQLALDTRIQPEVIYNRLADDHIARLELSITSGRAEDTLIQMALLSDLVSKLENEPQLQAEIQDKIVGATARFASNDAIQIQQLADTAVEQRLSKDETEAVLNNQGIDLYEQSMGVKVPDGVTRVEDISVENDLQQTYRDTVANSVDEGLTRHTTSGGKVDTALSVAFNPDQSSRADVRSTITLDGADRAAYLDTLIEAFPQPDPDDTDALILDDSMRRLSEQAKTDNAAYAALQSSLLSDSIHYGEGLAEFVTPNLEEATLSQEGLRQAIAYTEADLPTVARVVRDGNDVYALSQTIRASELDPTIDLVATYRQHLNDYESVRFDTKGATDTGFNIDQLLTSTKFLKDFLGTTNANLSSVQRKTIIGLIDLRSVDPKGIRGAVSPQLVEQLSAKGYYVIAEETASGSVVASIVNYSNIPEAVPSLDKESVTRGLNSNNSGFSRYTGTLLAPGEGMDFHDIALDVLRTDENLIKDERFKSVLTKEELFGLIDSGAASFHVASRQADARGVPIMFRFISNDGAIVRDIKIGRVHFSDPGYANRGPAFFTGERRRAQRLQESGNTFRFIRPQAPVRQFGTTAE